jgi:hypothetical protein
MVDGNSAWGSPTFSHPAIVQGTHAAQETNSASDAKVPQRATGSQRLTRRFALNSRSVAGDTGLSLNARKIVLDDRDPIHGDVRLGHCWILGSQEKLDLSFNGNRVPS